MFFEKNLKNPNEKSSKSQIRQKKKLSTHHTTFPLTKIDVEKSEGWHVIRKKIDFPRISVIFNLFKLNHRLGQFIYLISSFPISNEKINLINESSSHDGVKINFPHWLTWDYRSFDIWFWKLKWHLNYRIWVFCLISGLWITIYYAN